ncbi:MAG: PQQ-binding-like beta-propeller repeat protein [Woeseiaceae bacterium]|nr:PQQ-binding-like beta-propeller repeat protein [Woeseiaceae bacterium]
MTASIAVGDVADAAVGVEDSPVNASDGFVRALDVNTGEEMWQTTLPCAGRAVPMTYIAEGDQYIAIAAGGNRRTFTEEGDAIVAFRLASN